MLELKTPGLKDFDQSGGLHCSQQWNQNIFCMLCFGNHLIVWHAGHIPEVMHSVTHFYIQSLRIAADLLDKLHI